MGLFSKGKRGHLTPKKMVDKNGTKRTVYINPAKQPSVRKPGAPIVSTWKTPSPNGKIEGATTVVEDSAWVRDKATVANGAHLKDNVMVGGNAKVFKATVSGRSVIAGNAVVDTAGSVTGKCFIAGDSYLGGNSSVADEAHIHGNVKMFANARAEKNATIYGNVTIDDNTIISGETYLSVNQGYFTGNTYLKDKCTIEGENISMRNVTAEGNTTITGDNIAIPDNATLQGYAFITSNEDVATVKNNKGETVTFYKTFNPNTFEESWDVHGNAETIPDSMKPAWAV